MARMSKPWRAMALASVFVLAGCEPGTDMAASLMSSASAGSVEPAHVDLVEESAITAVVTNGLESLVVIQGSADDDGLLGAGCMVDRDEPLPDGDWFGFVLESTKHKLVVDIACVYGPGTDQFEVYSTAEETTWASYVVINDVVEERELRFGSQAQAYMAADNWEPRTIREVVEEAQTVPQLAPRGVWLRVVNGRIDAVVQPYSAGVAAG